MDALVIGGQGFIGAEIVRSLLAKGVNVTVADRLADARQCELTFGSGAVNVECVDILDAGALHRVIENFDSVYHLAGKLGTSEMDDDVVTGIEINIVGAVNVFKACVDHRTPKVFYASKPNIWLNTYTITKFAAEQFAQLYSTFGQTRFCSLRYFNAYGPRQANGPVRKIIPSFAQRAMLGLPLEVFGNGEQVVDMIFSQDIGRITVDFTEASDITTLVDCGRGIGMTVNEVARAVNAYFDNPAGISYLPMRRGETPQTELIADIAPLRQLLGNLNFSDWERSLAITLQWYAQQNVSAMAMK